MKTSTNERVAVKSKNKKYQVQDSDTTGGTKRGGRTEMKASQRNNVVSKQIKH
jgi:hypothetical protein